MQVDLQVMCGLGSKQRQSKSATTLQTWCYGVMLVHDDSERRPAEAISLALHLKGILSFPGSQLTVQPLCRVYVSNQFERKLQSDNFYTHAFA